MSGRVPVEPSDNELVVRCQRGEVSAFEELVRRYQSKAYGIALGMLHDPEDARDVVQDAFLKAYRNIGHFRRGSSFYTWFYRIVVNLSIDRLRRRSRSAQLEYDDALKRPEVHGSKGEELEPYHADSDPARNLERKELAEEIVRCLQALSPKHRAVVVLREFEGLSYKEMAATLGISIGTVMSRLFHARRKLQALLSEYLADEDLS